MPKAKPATITAAKPVPLDKEVKALLEEHRGDFKAISATSGVSYSWISKFLNGHIKNPGYAKLERLKVYLLRRKPKAA